MIFLHSYGELESEIVQERRGFALTLTGRIEGAKSEGDPHPGAVGHNHHHRKPSIATYQKREYVR